MYALRTLLLRNSLSNKDFTIKAAMLRGDQVEVLKKGNEYSYVTVNDKEGYVLSRYLSKQKPEHYNLSFIIETDDKDIGMHISNIEYYFSVLPKPVQDMFAKRNVSFLITNQVFHDREEVGGLAQVIKENTGITFRITLKACTSKNFKVKYVKAYSFFHECGHLINFMTPGNIIKTDEIKRLYDNEKIKESRVLRDYAFTNLSEFYAESFATYMCETLQIGNCKGKHDLEERCPELCRYIEKTLKMVEEEYKKY